jgi:hypothetical protein
MAAGKRATIFFLSEALCEGETMEDAIALGMDLGGNERRGAVLPGALRSIPPRRGARHAG